MLNDFLSYITVNNLVKQGDKILLAVSGGIDSMVMAHLFMQMENLKGIAHCNFSLRAAESDKDEMMVRQYADENHLPFHSVRFDTKTYAQEKGLSLQMAARELRYNWFEEIRSRQGYDYVSVAHNLNDNIETLLINLTRGTGITGLSGMKPLSDRIIRPLLFATRQDIVNYSLRNNIIFREDSSNTDTKYIRNKIRHQVIPVLKEINPSIETTLNETAERFSGICEIVSDYISALKDRISEQKGKSIVFKTNLLKEHLNNRSLLYELFRTYGINNSQLDDLISVINGKTGGQIITGIKRIIRNRNEILVTDNYDGNDIFFSIDKIEDFMKVREIDSAIYANITTDFKIPPDRLTACIDAEKIVFPLLIRKWRPGDFFYPLGMKSRKKLSDYFIDRKFSVIEKENKLILESGGKIVWIVGERIDERFRITRLTKKALIIKASSAG